MVAPLDPAATPPEAGERSVPGRALSRRAFLLAAGAAGLALEAPFRPGFGQGSGQGPAARDGGLPPSPAPAGDTRFRRVKLGGGGYVTDIDISRDGTTRLIKTDVFGCYVWGTDEDPRGAWQQLITRESMPESELVWGGWGSSFGCFDVRFAPSLPTRLYMVGPARAGHLSHVYRSDDRGRHWRRMALSKHMTTANDPHRTQGPKSAVDPANPDIYYVGTDKEGVFRTLDGGETFERVADIPAGYPVAIAFDPSSSRDGRTPVVYAMTGTNGVHATRDGGATWARIDGGPSAKPARMVCDGLGRLWVVEISRKPQNLWRLAGERWTLMPPGVGSGLAAVAVNPRNPAEVSVVSPAGNLSHSFDHGESWTGHYPRAGLRKTTDIPWLAWTKEDWLSTSNLAFDPVEPGRLWLSTGIGVYYTEQRRDAQQPVYTELTRGNDELIVNHILKPPGGALVVACQDRALFKLADPDRYPETHGPDRDAPIRHGWCVDYASSDPSFLVAIAQTKSGWSRDGGATWTPFASVRPTSPPGNLGGAIAASTPQNICWFPANNGAPFFTRDGGANWEPCGFPAPVIANQGWAFTMYQNRRLMCADRVLPHTFYAYNYKHGVLRSRDGGATWEVVPGTNWAIIGSMGMNAKMSAVPGQAGHLVWTCGTSGPPHPHDRNLRNGVARRSRDGGQTWTPLTGFTEAWTHAVGKAAPGGAPPALYVAGSRKDDPRPGIWRSDDDGARWTKITEHPATMDFPRDMAADLDVYGTLYLGLGGSGVVMGQRM